MEVPPHIHRAYDYYEPLCIRIIRQRLFGPDLCTNRTIVSSWRLGGGGTAGLQGLVPTCQASLPRGGAAWQDAQSILPLGGP